MHLLDELSSCWTYRNRMSLESFEYWKYEFNQINYDISHHSIKTNHIDLGRFQTLREVDDGVVDDFVGQCQFEHLLWQCAFNKSRFRRKFTEMCRFLLKISL